jgi:hypothetical protein
MLRYPGSHSAIVGGRVAGCAKSGEENLSSEKAHTCRRAAGRERKIDFVPD